MGRPKILTGVKFNLPAGSKWDPKAHAACKASSTDLMNQDLAQFCPKSSRYGAGKASVIVGTTPLSFPITSYNLQPLDFNRKRPELLLAVVLDPDNPALSFLIEGILSSHSVAFSLELAPQYDIHTTHIHFALPAAKKGKHAYLTTPRKCPKSKAWKASAQSTHSDGSKELCRLSSRASGRIPESPAEPQDPPKRRQARVSHKKSAPVAIKYICPVCGGAHHVRDCPRREPPSVAWAQAKLTSSFAACRS